MLKAFQKHTEVQILMFRLCNQIIMEEKEEVNFNPLGNNRLLQLLDIGQRVVVLFTHS